MFSQASVILFTGGGLCPSMHHRSHDQGVLCPGGVSVQGRVSVQGGVSVQGVLCPGGFCPGGSLSGGLCPGGSLSREVSVWGVSV